VRRWGQCGPDPTRRPFRGTVSKRQVLRRRVARQHEGTPAPPGSRSDRLEDADGWGASILRRPWRPNEERSAPARRRTREDVDAVTGRRAFPDTHPPWSGAARGPTGGRMRSTPSRHHPIALGNPHNHVPTARNQPYRRPVRTIAIPRSVLARRSHIHTPKTPSLKLLEVAWLSATWTAGHSPSQAKPAAANDQRSPTDASTRRPPCIR
jgi:hypothetical protein